MAQYSPFASFAPLGFNVASIMFNLLTVAFFVVVAIGIGFLVYAAKQLKKRETAAGE